MSLKIIWIVNLCRRTGEKNAGGKNEGKSHYVVENKWRKNVRNMPRHYMYENKADKGG
jgi:hypothetical protein